MTIVEALKIVLSDTPNGLTSKEAYQAIIANKLYSFPAKNPESVVNGTIRRHCQGLDFPTASAIKHFRISSYKGKKPCYALIDAQLALPTSIEEESKTIQSELLPEEILQNVYQKHLAEIKAELYRQIMNNHPSFFEHLIVNLLLAMGYGYDKSSGIVVGGSHDGGIDGIINEDKLGLDLIYLQAKRYKQGNSVGSKELQSFVGAMQDVKKGVFITTSGFTREARSYAECQQQKSLKLIDGAVLTDLLVKYKIGVKIEETINIYSLDSSFFN